MPPNQSIRADEIPAAVKRRLRLDDGRSWVVVSEWTEFVWPGPDLRRVPHGGDDSTAYGMLPPHVFATIQKEFLDLVKTQSALEVRRT